MEIICKNTHFFSIGKIKYEREADGVCKNDIGDMRTTEILT